MVTGVQTWLFRSTEAPAPITPEQRKEAGVDAVPDNESGSAAQGQTDGMKQS